MSRRIWSCSAPKHNNYDSINCTDCLPECVVDQQYRQATKQQHFQYWQSRRNTQATEAYPQESLPTELGNGVFGNEHNMRRDSQIGGSAEQSFQIRNMPTNDATYEPNTFTGAPNVCIGHELTYGVEPSQQIGSPLSNSFISSALQNKSDPVKVVQNRGRTYVVEGIETVKTPVVRPVDIIENRIEIPVKKVVERRVPKNEIREIIHEVPKTIVKKVEKVIEVPVIFYKDKVVEVPQYINVQKLQYKEETQHRLIYQPKIQVIEVPKYLDFGAQDCTTSRVQNRCRQDTIQGASCSRLVNNQKCRGSPSKPLCKYNEVIKLLSKAPDGLGNGCPDVIGISATCPLNEHRWKESKTFAYPHQN